MAPATSDLTKPANLAIFTKALAKAPKDVLERSILEAAQRDGRVAKTFWDALVQGGGKGAKYETCRHCAQSFDTTASGHESCADLSLVGNLVADEGFWNEYYESESGPIRSKENKKQYPQSFFWDCCGLQLPAAGCLRTAHAPRVVLTRNGRDLEALVSERTKGRWGRDIYDREVVGAPPAKKRKVATGAQTKCRTCGTLYDENENTERVCR
ncbi:hypothetical protein B0H17DRAFT_1198954 [Mycena rosella]|uniref:Uncharacterized protein n=1 Tax=Mycena rosella TaxID=1033263 RepID=A0AAD7GK85_MYCRO|nr:hypothetical protein B0H17DRAFT_1198954 [Mycena rosella]